MVGVDDSPRLLRENGLVESLRKLEWRIDMRADTSIDPVVHPSEKAQEEEYNQTHGCNLKNATLVGRLTYEVAQEVGLAVNKGQFALTIGGDHSVSLGTLMGLLKHRPDTGVVWVDAHADLNTPLMSESGNMHGMPVGLAMDHPRRRNKIPGFEWLKEYTYRLDPKQICYVGLRDLDTEERQFLLDHNIKVLLWYVGLDTLMWRNTF